MSTPRTDFKWLNGEGWIEEIAYTETNYYIHPMETVPEPQFVGSFDIGEYVYFFFRETAIEYAHCAKAIYSRVARICKVLKMGSKHKVTTTEHAVVIPVPERYRRTAA